MGNTSRRRVCVCVCVCVKQTAEGVRASQGEDVIEYNALTVAALPEH